MMPGSHLYVKPFRQGSYGGVLAWMLRGARDNIQVSATYINYDPYNSYVESFPVDPETATKVGI